MFVVYHDNKGTLEKINAYLFYEVRVDLFDKIIEVDILENSAISTDGWTYFDGDTIFVEYKTQLGLAHELIHVSQILNKRFNPDNHEWYGKVYRQEQPWEDEAYKLELEVEKRWLM